MVWALAALAGTALAALVWRLRSDERVPVAEGRAVAWSQERALWVVTGGLWVAFAAWADLGAVSLLVGVAVALLYARRA